jgi:ATP-dependent DNA helicase RecG
MPRDASHHAANMRCHDSLIGAGRQPLPFQSASIGDSSPGHLEKLDMATSDLNYKQTQMFTENQALISTKIEDHWFDRKSFKIAPVALANLMVGFANADGGTILIGVEKDGQILGVDENPEHLNRLRQAALDFTFPPVRHSTSFIQCQGVDRSTIRVLAIEVSPGTAVHRNNRDEVFLRVGDQNRKLGLEATQELLYDKGQTVFDGTLIPGSTIEELDREAIQEFKAIVGASASPELALKARGLVIDHDGYLAPTCAAVLLFSKHPERFLPGALIRILRYEGDAVQFGTRSNLTLDVRIAGSLPEQIALTEQLLRESLRSVTRLNPQSGRFETVPELPRFAWLEAVVNAVTHRSYSHQGDHIRVRLFDDRMEVESPGKLPGAVRIDNIRYTRFSRNPRISRVLADLKLVQELNEGVNRMFEEMTLAGLQDPVLHQTESGFRVTLFNHLHESVGAVSELVPGAFGPVIEELQRLGHISNARAMQLSNVSAPTARRYLQRLADTGLLERVETSPRDPRGFWRLKQ